MTSEEQLLARRDALWDERAVFMEPTDKSPLSDGELRCLKQIHAELKGIDEEIEEEGYGLEAVDQPTWSAARPVIAPTRDRAWGVARRTQTVTIPAMTMERLGVPEADKRISRWGPRQVKQSTTCRSGRPKVSAMRL